MLVKCMKITAVLDNQASARVQVFIEEENFLTTKKEVPVDAFVQIINSASYPTEEFFMLGTLPKGYVNGKISLQRQDTFEVVLSLPKGVYPLVYFGETRMIPYPALVFKFRVKSGKLNQGWCVAKREDGTLCRYPYGNVYDNTHICWGNLEKGCKSLGVADVLISYFLVGGTNNDMFHVPSTEKGKPIFKDVPHFLKNMETKKTFPERYLTPLSVTMEEWMK